MVGNAVSVASTTSAASCVAYQRVLVLSAIGGLPSYTQRESLGMVKIVADGVELHRAASDGDAHVLVDRLPALPSVERGIEQCGGSRAKLGRSGHCLSLLIRLTRPNRCSNRKSGRCRSDNGCQCHSPCPTR